MAELEQDGGFSPMNAALAALVGFFTINAVQSDDGGDEDNVGGTAPRPIGGDDGSDNGDGDMSEIDELLKIQRRQHGHEDGIDAYVGEVLELPAGATGTVTVEPREGFNLETKKLYFDRRSDHEYSHYVDGSEISENHQANLRVSRRVLHGGHIVGEVVNNSEDASVVDYEFEGWGVKAEDDV